MDIQDMFDRWIDGQIIDYGLGQPNLSQTEDFFAKKAEEIYHETESSADQAFVDMLQLVAFINTVSSKKPDILGKLAEIVAKLKRALERIAEEKIADSYSISAGFPFGISVGLSWDTDSPEKKGAKK